jgi:1-acyl-sn-glycerol-3-phosphate acyltransferase
MCDSKKLNIFCRCGNFFIDSYDDVVSIYPCEHLIHLKCLTDKKSCPHCNTKIIKVVYINDYKSNANYTQQSIDIFSVTKLIKNNQINVFNIISRIPKVADIAIKFYNVKTKKDYKKILENIFSLTDVTIKVNGLNKIRNSDKKVFVSNHVTFADPLFLYYVLECGFLANNGIKKYIEHIEKIIPLVYIKRGYKQNAVQLMKQYVDTHGSICVFAEGTLSKFGTLYKFRSGAFNIGYPIYPIVIKYNNMNFSFTDIDIVQALLHYCSIENSTIEITILDPIYPPFNEKTPEIIREKMAKSGNFVLSRVCAGNIKD